MLITHADAPSRYASYNRWYWAGWGICLLVLLLVFGGTPTVTHLGVFGVITGFAAVCVFQFEFDRYQGFIESNFPERLQPLATARRFGILAFFHPHLLRELFGDARGLPEGYVTARSISRGTLLFCGVTLACLMLLGTRSALERVPSFSMLGKDDVVDVHYSRKSDRTVLGTLSLTYSDLDKLDEPLGCLRSGRSRNEKWGNVVTIVTLTHRRGGRVIATERFKNSGCDDLFRALILRAEDSNLGDDGMKK